MSTVRSSRAAALFGIVVTALSVVYTLVIALGATDPEWAYLPRGVIHLGELAVVVAVWLTGAAGTGLLGRIGLGAAAAGSLLMTLAEVITSAAPGVSIALFGIAPMIVGLGLVLAGVGIVRHGAWTGWRRLVVLALGLYVFVVLTPALIVSGGPPATAALWAIAGWDALWALVGVSVLMEVRATSRATTSVTG